MVLPTPHTLLHNVMHAIQFTHTYTVFVEPAHLKELLHIRLVPKSKLLGIVAVPFLSPSLQHQSSEG